MSIESIQKDNECYRYEKLVRFIMGLLENGILRPGMRAPSLRNIASQHGVSITTALQAYQMLEGRNVLEARPKSGFYITSNNTISLSVPSISNPPAKATEVVVLGGVLQLLEFASDDDIVPLGGAIPSAHLLKSSQLDRFLARAARSKGTEYNTYTAPQGNIMLRTQISQRAIRWGYHLAPDDITITCGCTEALSLALSSAKQSKTPISFI